MRLQKYLARAGVASRRNSEKLIVEGRVSVNNEIVMRLGTTVNEVSDIIKVDGNTVRIVENKVILALNKPCGVVTTMSDPQGRKTVSDIVDTQKNPGIFPVGRLDFGTSGLLLLTNDGELGAKLMHPSSLVEKTYIAKVKGSVKDSELETLRQGVNLGDFTTSPAKVNAIDASTLEITIHEGKNRQVRRMCKAVGHEVKALQRVKYANITLDGLESGDIREITGEELRTLKTFVSVE